MNASDSNNVVYVASFVLEFAIFELFKEIKKRDNIKQSLHYVMYVYSVVQDMKRYKLTRHLKY